jgi:hypothetical protein
MQALGLRESNRGDLNRPVASTRQRQAGLILAVFGWAAAFLLTLYPSPEQADTASATSVWCLVCGQLGMVDVTLNTILFLPLGLGLGLLGVARFRALVAIALTTLTIEVLQLGIVVGRDASLSDLLTNLAGGAIGYWLASHWRRVLFPPRKASLVVALLGALGWLLVQAFTGFALQRILPRSVYYGQWSPELGQFEQFTGQVVSVRLNTTPLPGSRLKSSDQVRAALLATESVLEVRALSGHPTSDVAPIFSIFDDRQREIVLVGQDGLDLIYRVRTRTGPLGLRSPALRLSNALPSLPGARLELRARYTPGHYHLEAEIGPVSYTRDLALSTSWGWTFLLPFDHAFGAEMPWLTILWVGGLLLPVGYYAGQSGLIRGRVAAGGLLLVLLIGFGVIPALSNFAIFHPLEWMAGILGPVVGYGLGRKAWPLVLPGDSRGVMGKTP